MKKISFIAVIFYQLDLLLQLVLIRKQKQNN